MERRDYDEVRGSVERRSTAVYGMRAETDRLLTRIRFSVRDVDYAREVVPHLDEVLLVVNEQVEAEERFASAVAAHLHVAAPDHATLRGIYRELQQLIRSLTDLQRLTATVKGEFEAEQDRQLLTYRRITVNPQSDLLVPLMDRTPTAVCELDQALAVWVGVRAPEVLQLRSLFERTISRPPQSDPDAVATPSRTAT